MVIRNSNYTDSVYPEVQLSGTPLTRTLVIRNSNYTDSDYPEVQLSGLWLSGTPIKRTLFIRKSNYPGYCYPELHLPGLWLSGTPIIRTLFIRKSNYPDQLDPSGTNLLTAIVLHLFMTIFPLNCQIHVMNFVLMFCLYVHKYVPQIAFCRFFTLYTANVAYFRIKIQLSGFSAYPVGTPSQLIRIIGVLLYLCCSIVRGRKGGSEGCTQ